MKPVLRYPGSKWRIAKEIVDLIPEHRSYIEPYFGSGAILFSKNKSNIETINDLDDDIINLFYIIQTNPKKLMYLIRTTPYGRNVYERAYLIPKDDYEKALFFLIRCWQGYGFRTTGKKVGWKKDVTGREKSYTLTSWNDLPEVIRITAERLKNVQIESRPALEVIEHFNYENVFMYIDPPYLLSTRTGKQYKHEMNDSDHKELLKTIKKSKAKIMISGYENDLYSVELKNWNKEVLFSNDNSGKRRKEIVWMNYLPQPSLFDIGELDG